MTAILVHPILANHTTDDSIISITHSPIPVKTDSGSVTFTITATRDIFDTSGDYWYNTWRVDGTNKDRCPDLIGPITTSNPRRFVVTSTIRGCSAEIGNWKFELWLGRGIVSRSDSSLIIKDYNFAIEQAGGGIPQLFPVRTPLGLSETPYVNLINARQGNKYEFWWDSATREFAKKTQASVDGNISNIELSKVGVDFSKPGRKVLCMEVGDDLFPAGVRCRYRAEFEFTAIPPPPPRGQPDCSIQPPTPTEDDSVSIKAVNLPNNQEFQAELISGGRIISLPTKQNSGDSGTVLLNLAAHLGLGSYTGIVRDSNNQEVCRKEFTVGPRGTGETGGTGDKCDPKDPSYNAEKAAKECTSSGGPDVLCDLGNKENPGIRTAIGCIHTSPVGFIKDFLKFIIGIAGGLAFLMMLLGAFQMLTSAGNPDTLAAGKDRLTSAIIGLLFVIFSVLLLQIIGVDILGLGEQFGFK